VGRGLGTGRVEGGADVASERTIQSYYAQCNGPTKDRRATALVGFANVLIGLANVLIGVTNVLIGSRRC